MAERDVIHLTSQLDALRKSLACPSDVSCIDLSKQVAPVRGNLPKRMCTHRRRLNMTKREGQTAGVIRGRQYPGIKGKVVDFADHSFEEGMLYIRVRFTDKTELCWRITSGILIEEADLSDWKTGDFRQICVFVESSRE